MKIIVRTNNQKTLQNWIDSNLLWLSKFCTEKIIYGVLEEQEQVRQSISFSHSGFEAYVSEFATFKEEWLNHLEENEVLTEIVMCTDQIIASSNWRTLIDDFHENTGLYPEVTTGRVMINTTSEFISSDNESVVLNHNKEITFNNLEDEIISFPLPGVQIFYQLKRLNFFFTWFSTVASTDALSAIKSVNDLDAAFDLIFMLRVARNASPAYAIDKIQILSAESAPNNK